jgi:hypothetical protein
VKTKEDPIDHLLRQLKENPVALNRVLFNCLSRDADLLGRPKLAELLGYISRHTVSEGELGRREVRGALADLSHAYHEHGLPLLGHTLDQLRRELTYSPVVSRGVVRRPPGSTLEAIAEFFCSRKSFERVAKPAIADLHFEYFEALNEGRKLKAAWVRVRGTWGFWFALGAVRLMKVVHDVWEKVRSL